MTELELFYQLKEQVLRQYKESHPYFMGNWKSFTSQDILNLIDDIQCQTKQTISEKWIYTHLKPEVNVKLPRKDMLAILCSYAQCGSWEEFTFKSLQLQPPTQEQAKPVSKPTFTYFYFAIGGLLLLGLLGTVWWFGGKSNKKESLQLQNSYTKDTVAKKEIKAYVIEDTIEKPIDLDPTKMEFTKPTQVVLKSPFYEPKKVVVQPNEPLTTIELKPNDYALILKAFMKSDIKNWQIRKQQLQKILADELEVIILLPNNLGAEYFNKEEFAQKLIIPSPSLKKMTIVELQQNDQKRITFIRITQP
ncbi:hypothetical protein [Flavobacterium sp.]|uniref:hypothetical protein n=1 Tax=Flavobacterium sp. TaxID=239 RepID=UPI0035B40C6C